MFSSPKLLLVRVVYHSDTKAHQDTNLVWKCRVSHVPGGFKRQPRDHRAWDLMPPFWSWGWTYGRAHCTPNAVSLPRKDDPVPVSAQLTHVLLEDGGRLPRLSVKEM